MTVPINRSVASRAIALISCRRSLLTIATLALAERFTGSASTTLGKQSGHKSKRKAKQKARPLCLAQVNDCRDMLFALCGDSDDPDGCASPSLPCCEFFATCDATSALECFFTSSASSAARAFGPDAWQD